MATETYNLPLSEGPWDATTLRLDGDDIIIKDQSLNAIFLHLRSLRTDITSASYAVSRENLSLLLGTIQDSLHDAISAPNHPVELERFHFSIANAQRALQKEFPLPTAPTTNHKPCQLPFPHMISKPTTNASTFPTSSATQRSTNSQP